MKMIVAAAFFVTYEALKKQAPKISSSLTSNSSLTHLLAATGGEFVSRPPRTFSPPGSPIFQGGVENVAPTDGSGIMFDSSPYRDCEITYSDWSLWPGEIILELIDPDYAIRRDKRVLSRFRNNDSKRGQS